MDIDDSTRVILLTCDVYNVIHDTATLILGDNDDDDDDNGEPLRKEATRRKRNTRTARSSVRLQNVYRNVKTTLDALVQLIRAYRRQLLIDENAVLTHEDTAREHEIAYDHHASSNGLLARCTVIAIEYVRELMRSNMRETLKRFIGNTTKRGAPSSSSLLSSSSSTRNGSRARTKASFFTYIHKKIANRAAWLVNQQTIERQRGWPRNGKTRDSGGTCRAADNIEQQLACHVCRRIFDKTFHYLQHIRVHYRLNLYLCTHCNEAFVQQNGLNYHIRHCCPVAVATTAKRTKRRKMQARELSSCGTAEATTLVTINGVEDDALHYELCDSCGRFFENGRELRNHVLRCHAACNIDLGINRTQQEYVRAMLSVENDDREDSSFVYH